jgi:CRISPR-associated endoribonuclease Cas6
LNIELPYKKFEFQIIPSEPLILPSYKGSTLRGGFGNAFKKVVCAFKKTDCAECILKEKCVYSYIFETPPPSDTKIMRKYKTAPHPFIIEPPPEKRRGYKLGDEISFGLTLIGRAIDYLPYFIYTFSELGNIGIGKAKGKYILKKVLSVKVSDEGSVIPRFNRGIQDNKTEIIYSSDTKTLKSFTPSIMSFPRKWESSLNFKSPNSELLTLNFLTPTRIIYDGHLTLDLEFHVLIRNLIRRFSLLYYFHCGGDPSKWNFKEIIEKSRQVLVKQRNLSWYDWERYSFRQGTRMKMGGFVGRVTFEGNIEPFMPVIRAGEVLHVGKGTAFGLGKYEIINTPTR